MHLFLDVKSTCSNFGAARAQKTQLRDCAFAPHRPSNRLPNVQTIQGASTALKGPTALRRCGLNLPARLRSCSQGENDPRLVPDPFSGLYRVFGMAALLAGSEPDGLQRVVHFGS